MELNELTPSKMIVVIVAVSLVFSLALYCILTIGKLDKAEQRILELAAQKTCIARGYSNAVIHKGGDAVTCSNDLEQYSLKTKIDFNTTVAYEQCCCITGYSTANNKCYC